MSATDRPWWQFSLWELLIFTTVVAAVTTMVKLLGWGIGWMFFHPLIVLIVFAILIDRRLKHRLRQQREERQRQQSAIDLKSAKDAN